jgi:acetylornithine/N-succinyldiaminopimelate aminotransferase
MPRVEAIFSRIAAGVSALEDVTLRGAGCLMGLQTPLLAKELRDRLLSHDILVGVSAEPNTVRLLPPYVLSDQEIDRFVDVLTRIIEEHHR